MKNNHYLEIMDSAEKKSVVQENCQKLEIKRPWSGNKSER